MVVSTLSLVLLYRHGEQLTDTLGSRFVEVNLFIICGSMPTLRRFFRSIAPKIMGSSHDNSRVKHAGPSNSSRGPRSEYSQFDTHSHYDVEMNSMSSQQVILEEDKSAVRHANFEVKSQ